MFDQLPDLHFKLPVIIPEYSRIAESTYTWVIPLMMQFLVLKCISTYTRGRFYTSIYGILNVQVCVQFGILFNKNERGSPILRDGLLPVPLPRQVFGSDLIGNFFCSLYIHTRGVQKVM